MAYKVAYPGEVVQKRYYPFTGVATGTTAIPNDDSKPQSGEGNEFMTAAFTPICSFLIQSVHALDNPFKQFLLLQGNVTAHCFFYLIPFGHPKTLQSIFALLG